MRAWTRETRFESIFMKNVASHSVGWRPSTTFWPARNLMTSSPPLFKRWIVTMPKQAVAKVASTRVGEDAQTDAHEERAPPLGNSGKKSPGEPEYLEGPDRPKVSSLNKRMWKQFGFRFEYR